MLQKKGFTLIELLVVIAIIALLLSILLPSLRAAKELASGVVCTSNQKNLVNAWILYAQENNGRVVGGSTYRGGGGTPYRWVEGPLIDPIYGSAEATESQYSEETRFNGIRAGKLFTYLENEKIYHCSGDKTIRRPEPYSVFRSYSITGLMNGEDFVTRSSEFGDISEYRKVTLDGVERELKVATKRTQIRASDSKLVFMEEDVTVHNQKYNAGSWVLLGGGYTWWDVPAGFHNGGGTFSFADGHAGRRKWRDHDTVALAEKNIPDPDPGNNEDLRWLARGYIPR